MKIYTHEQWCKDSAFKALPGQEIEASIYDEMLDVLPPKPLPRKAAEQSSKDYGISISAGFLMGEPHGFVGEGLTYLAFGMSGKRCYYLGLSTAR